WGEKHSDNSAQVSATPNKPGTGTSVGTPGGVTAIAGNAQISLSWSAINGATSYHVKRATKSGGPYTQIGAPTVNNFTDKGLTNGTAYFYVVSAVNAKGESANSAQVSTTPKAPASAPSAPTGVTATARNAQATVSWSASSGATSYNVKRSTTNGEPYSTVS